MDSTIALQMKAEIEALYEIMMASPEVVTPDNYSGQEVINALMDFEDDLVKISISYRRSMERLVEPMPEELVGAYERMHRKIGELKVIAGTQPKPWGTRILDGLQESMITITTPLSELGGSILGTVSSIAKLIKFLTHPISLIVIGLLVLSIMFPQIWVNLFRKIQAA